MKLKPNQSTHCAIRLRASASHLSRRLRAVARGEGVSVAKLSVLGQLYRSGPLTATMLARLEGVKPQSLTRLLAELEVDKLIARHSHPQDGRQALLSLTTIGAACLRQDVQRREAALTSAISVQLSDTEQALLLEACALMDRVAESLT